MTSVIIHVIGKWIEIHFKKLKFYGCPRRIVPALFIVMSIALTITKAAFSQSCQLMFRDLVCYNRHTSIWRDNVNGNKYGKLLLDS